ncbi:MAG: HAMP domain-containing sensor histidine kinase [Myxococcota bacterium]
MISRPLDPADWTALLPAFAAATGLVVSLYDERGDRLLGPFAPSALGSLLQAAGLWDDAGAGTREEQALVGTSLAGGASEALVGGALRVLAQPVELHERICGVVVYGWVFEAFASSLGCNALGAAIGVDGAALWRIARRTSPLSAAQQAVYTELLQAMVAAVVRQIEANHRLLELANAREAFLARVSHDLRTPLQAMRLRLQLLQHAPEDAEEHVAQMLRNVVDQAALVDDLVDGARTMTGHLSVKLEPTSLARVVRESVGAIAPQAQAAGVRLAADLPEGEPFDAPGDPHRLRQVFWNLLQNAVKFTPSGGGVVVTAQASGAEVVVRITDSGRGMGDEELLHVFEPYVTLDGERGIGLGLAIAHEIVALHGGTLRADRPGRGRSTAHRDPAAVAPLKELVVVRDWRSAAGGGARSSSEARTAETRRPAG